MSKKNTIIDFALFGFILPIIIDGFIAIAIGELLNVSIFKAFVAFEVIKGIYYLLNRGVELTARKILNNKDGIDIICNTLNSNRFPNSDKYKYISMLKINAKNYFYNVSGDQELDDSTRVVAAYFLGHIEGRDEDMFYSWYTKSMYMKAIRIHDQTTTSYWVERLQKSE